MIVRAFEVSGESNSQNPCQTVADLEKMLNHSNEQGETLEIQCFALSTSAPSRSRTYDLMIKSHLLYQLSYRGLVGTEMVSSLPASGKQPPGWNSLRSRIRAVRSDVKSGVTNG